MAGSFPVGRALHHDAPLANIAVQAFQTAAENEGFVAQRIMPIVPVAKQSDQYYVIDKDAWLVTDNDLRAPKAAPREVMFQVSSDAYFCKNYVLAQSIAKEDLVNADVALQLRQTAARAVTDKLLRGYEIRVANLLTSGSNLGSYVSLSGTAKWSDYTNSDPISAVESGAAFIWSRTGLEPNTMVLDRGTYKILKGHPVVRDRFDGKMPDDAQLKELFNVENLYVTKGVKNNAAYSATASLTSIWGNSCLLLYVEPQASLMSKSFGLSFRWQPDGIPSPMQVFVYDDPHPGKKAEYVEVGYYQDEKIVARDLCYGILSTL
jgi:hypothetical protein